MKVQVLGMPWYRKETFSRLRTMFDDGEKLHRTYEEWLEAANLTRKRLEARGLTVVRVDIDPDEFPLWCKQKGMKINAKARNTFAGLIAYRLVTGRQESIGIH